MSLLDLVFIVFFLSVPLGLAAVVVALVLRRRALAQRISVTLGVWVVLYLGVLLVVSLVSPLASWESATTCASMTGASRSPT